MLGVRNSKVVNRIIEGWLRTMPWCLLHWKAEGFERALREALR